MGINDKVRTVFNFFFLGKSQIILTDKGERDIIMRINTENKLGSRIRWQVPEIRKNNNIISAANARKTMDLPEKEARQQMGATDLYLGNEEEGMSECKISPL